MRVALACTLAFIASIPGNGTITLQVQTIHDGITAPRQQVTNTSAAE
jgi:hypothetical protein